MIGPGETARCAAPKGNAEALRQKGRAMTTLRRVRWQPHAEGATCRKRRGISQVMDGGTKPRGRVSQTVKKPDLSLWGCMKGPGPLHIQSAAAACTQQGWKPFGLPSRQRRPRTAKSKILTPRRRSGPSGRFLYHFLSRPNLGFAGLGFRPCGALRRCPRAFSRVNAASDRPSPKVTGK